MNDYSPLMQLAGSVARDYVKNCYQRPSTRTKLLGGVSRKALDAGAGVHNQVVEMAHEQSKVLLKVKYGR